MIERHAAMKTLLTNGEDPAWRDDVHYPYYEKSFGSTAHYGIKTDRFKLIHFHDPVGNRELYDLEKDPHELVNVYRDSAYSATVADLMRRMLALQKYYKDEEAIELNDR